MAVLNWMGSAQIFVAIKKRKIAVDNDDGAQLGFPCVNWKNTYTKKIYFLSLSFLVYFVIARKRLHGGESIKSFLSN